MDPSVKDIAFKAIFEDFRLSSAVTLIDTYAAGENQDLHTACESFLTFVNGNNVENVIKMRVYEDAMRAKYPRASAGQILFDPALKDLVLQWCETRGYGALMALHTMRSELGVVQNS